MTGIIYQIHNKINGHSYIGKTAKSLEHRFYRHKWNARHNHQTHLYRALRKYGIDNFTITAIETPILTELDDRERYWIAQLTPEYNMTEGGDGGDTSSSPNYQDGMKRRRDMSGPNNPMYGRKRIMSEKTKLAIRAGAGLANRCPVMCEGVYYACVGDAEKAYPGVKVRRLLDDPAYPEFVRLGKKKQIPRSRA